MARCGCFALHVSCRPLAPLRHAFRRRRQPARLSSARVPVRAGGAAPTAGSGFDPGRARGRSLPFHRARGRAELPPRAHSFQARRAEQRARSARRRSARRADGALAAGKRRFAGASHGLVHAGAAHGSRARRARALAAHATGCHHASVQRRRSARMDCAARRGRLCARAVRYHRGAGVLQPVGRGGRARLDARPARAAGAGRHGPPAGCRAGGENRGVHHRLPSGERARLAHSGGAEGTCIRRAGGAADRCAPASVASCRCGLAPDVQHRAVNLTGQPVPCRHPQTLAAGALPQPERADAAGFCAMAIRSDSTCTLAIAFLRRGNRASIRIGLPAGFPMQVPA